MKIVKALLAACVAIMALLFAVVLLLPSIRGVEKMDAADARGKSASVVRLDNGVSINYVESGSGEKTIILLHGFGSSIYTWKYVIPALEKSGMRVIAPDMMGFGFSDKPEGAQYGYKAFAEVLREFMDKKGIKTASIAGNSMGGGIAVYFTAVHPERVERAILVDSAGHAHKKGGELGLLGSPLLGKFMFSLNSPQAQRLILKRMCFFNADKITDERMEAYFKAFTVKGSAQAAAATINSITTERIEDKIAQINKPTLIIWGAKDKLIPPEYAGRFHSEIKGSTLLMIPESGHLPEEEKPEVVSAAIIAFMNGKPVPGAEK